MGLRGNVHDYEHISNGSWECMNQKRIAWAKGPILTINPRTSLDLVTLYADEAPRTSANTSRIHAARASRQCSVRTDRSRHKGSVVFQ